MKIQGYIEIAHQPMTDEEFEEFNAFLSRYMLHYYLCSTIGGREYYHCIMIDDAYIEPLVEAMGARNPVINGMWQQDGTPYGQTKTDTVSVDGAVTTDISGNPTYSLDIALHLSHTPAKVVYDDNGDVLSETPATEFKPLHGFSGWAKPEEY